MMAWGVMWWDGIWRITCGPEELGQVFHGVTPCHAQGIPLLQPVDQPASSNGLHTHAMLTLIMPICHCSASGEPTGSICCQASGRDSERSAALDTRPRSHSEARR